MFKDFESAYSPVDLGYHDLMTIGVPWRSNCSFFEFSGSQIYVAL